MEPRIETLTEKKLIGMHMSMSFADNKTGDLWRGFMPRRKEITNALGTDLFSMQLYPPSFDFNPLTSFEKWAAVAVTDFNNIPDGMETYVLPGGLYAVFHYKGSSADAPRVFGYIFSEWLPTSGYTLDNRPHFELIGEKYKNNDPDSAEEIWIPVKPKN